MRQPTHGVRVSLALLALALGVSLAGAQEDAERDPDPASTARRLAEVLRTAASTEARVAAALALGRQAGAARTELLMGAAEEGRPYGIDPLISGRPDNRRSSARIEPCDG